MAVRQVYSCDWCCVDSPSSGYVGGDWRVVARPADGEKLHMCPECFTAGCAAWESARLQRRWRRAHPR